jgi:hypothetical protein
MWDWCWFMTFFQSLWRHKTTLNREHPATVPTVMKKKNFTKFAREWNIMTRSAWNNFLVGFHLYYAGVDDIKVVLYRHKIWAHPWVCVRTKTGCKHQSRLPSKPSPDKHKSWHATHRSRDSPSNGPKGKDSPGKPSRQEHYALVHRHYM